MQALGGAGRWTAGSLLLSVPHAARAGAQRRWGSADTPPPGRFGDPRMQLRTDPRLNDAIRDHFSKEVVLGYGLIAKPPYIPLNRSRRFQHAFFRFLESYALPVAINEKTCPYPDASTIVQREETCVGVDGNTVKMYIASPDPAAAGVNPAHGMAMLHIHGGGMMVGSAKDRMYTGARMSLAADGWTVVSVEFRNTSGNRGPHPFPAGLNDCMSALQHLHDNRGAWGIDRVIVSGESGGGNLSAAVAIKAKKDARLHQIDGVYLMCPYIAGTEVWKAQPADLPSLKECESYFLSPAGLAIAGELYDVENIHTMNPMAWPYTAERKHLEGLPPHYVSVNELDPLRDEGLAYHAKLADAGVRTHGRVIKGTPHAGELLARTVPGCTHFWEDTLAEMKKFGLGLPKRAA